MLIKVKKPPLCVSINIAFSNGEQRLIQGRQAQRWIATMSFVEDILIGLNEGMKIPKKKSRRKSNSHV